MASFFSSLLRRRRAATRLAASVLVVFLLAACSTPAASTPSADPVSGAAGRVIQVVAAENFYGDLASQLGGAHVSVVSILSNPNVDPHEYESNMQTATAVYHAGLVIENGASYDTWMDKLLSASPNPQRIVITAATVAPHQLADNPHLWYSLVNMQAVAQAITQALVKLDPQDAAVFNANLSTFQASLAPVQQVIDAIKSRYAGTPVGLTETIFLYQTELTGLKVLTPLAFEKAIAEGNDPPADSVVTTNDQVIHKQVKVLIYNQQTVTPITTNLENEAKAAGIPLVSVTETMPEGKTYQQWMLDQLSALKQALQTNP